MTTNQEIKLCVSKVCMHLVSLDYYIVCIVGIDDNTRVCI